MPQTSIPYAVSRIRVHEGRLINIDGFRRMLGGSLSEAVHVLSEAGYGSFSSAEDYEQLLRVETEALNGFIKEITPNESLTDCFFCRYDYFNLKGLIKARAEDIDWRGLVIDCGLISLDKLRLAVYDHDYLALPEGMRRLMSYLEAAQHSPQETDAYIDRAMYEQAHEHIQKSGSAFWRDYFYDETAIFSIISALRLKKAGIEREAAELIALPFGKVSLRDIQELFSASDEQLDDKVHQLFPALDEAMHEYLHGRGTAQLERAGDNYLLKKAAGRKNESFTADPVIVYYLARLQEIKNARIVLVTVANGLDAAQANERLRDVYV